MKYSEKEVQELLECAMESKDKPKHPQYIHPAIGIHVALKRSMESTREEDKTELDITYSEWLVSDQPEPASSFTAKIFSILNRR